MQSTSFAFRRKIAENSKVALKATLTFADGTVRELTGEDFAMGGVSVTTATSTTGSFDIGAAVMGSCDVTLANYDQRFDNHMRPGGVISTTVYQLEKLGIADKLDEVLEEVPRIHAEMGYPVMITPPSQFIVSQAAVNVATGERYKQPLDCMVDMALGRYGVKDAGLDYMDQNLKDRLLSTPSAKLRAKKFKELEEKNATITVAQICREMGMENASDEEFCYAYALNGSGEEKLCTTPKSYYTGKEPLGLLLTQLAKDHNVSRLEMKGC